MPIDYFADCKDPLEKTLRRIKGDYRRTMVAQSAAEEGLDSIPSRWTEHDMKEMFKSMLQRSHPSARGGEDLPDLEDGQVELPE